MSVDRIADKDASRAAIVALVAAYGRGADDRDASLFRSVWHGDAVWIVPPHRFAGHDQILDAVARQWSAFESMHHSTSGSTIEFLSDDEAVGRHDVESLTVMPGGRQLLTTGKYCDRYTRRGGRWSIAEREATVSETVELPPL